MFGSSVVPDLLDTQNKVRAGSIFARKARIWAGSVESRTNSCGALVCFPKVMLKTSGQRLEPPIPNKIRWAKPSSAISAAKALKRETPASCSSTISSQPSHLLSSVLVHKEASWCQRRAVEPAASQLWRFADTACESSVGSEAERRSEERRVGKEWRSR